jgi:hypothetical protein
MTVPYACTLLEYCLVTGLDWWDLLVSLRPSMMDTVCERFTESFNRQLQHVQQFHYVQFLNIKTSLYRCSKVWRFSVLMRTATALYCPLYFLLTQLLFSHIMAYYNRIHILSHATMLCYSDGVSLPVFILAYQQHTLIPNLLHFSLLIIYMFIA